MVVLPVTVNCGRTASRSARCAPDPVKNSPMAMSCPLGTANFVTPWKKSLVANSPNPPSSLRQCPTSKTSARSPLSGRPDRLVPLTVRMCSRKFTRAPGPATTCAGGAARDGAVAPGSAIDSPWANRPSVP